MGHPLPAELFGQGPAGRLFLSFCLIQTGRGSRPLALLVSHFAQVDSSGVNRSSAPKRPRPAGVCSRGAGRGRVTTIQAGWAGLISGCVQRLGTGGGAGVADLRPGGQIGGMRGRSKNWWPYAGHHRGVLVLAAGSATLAAGRAWVDMGPAANPGVLTGDGLHGRLRRTHAKNPDL